MTITGFGGTGVSLIPIMMLPAAYSVVAMEKQAAEVPTAVVLAAAINSNGHAYQYLHQNPAQGTGYYRLIKPI